MAGEKLEMNREVPEFWWVYSKQGRLSILLIVVNKGS